MMGKAAKAGVGASDYGITIEVGAPARAAAPATGDVQLRTGEVLLDRYRIEGCLGAGGMGTVYLAEDRVRSEHAHIDGRVALKIVHAAPDKPASVLDKLRHEFYCAQALSHPSIVKVFELEGSDELAFFTMELLDGELLSDLMKGSQPHPLPRPQAWSIIREIGDGLAHAHSRNIVHGDLKPHNVMVLKEGGLRILDFGAAGYGSDADNGGAAALTPAYASCQLLEGGDADRRDDIFALACVAYELLTGEHPFQRRRATEARDANLAPKEPKNLSARQWLALQRGLAWSSEDRPGSVQEWLTELVLSSAPRSKRAREEDAVESPPRKLSASSLRWGLAAALPLALITGWVVIHGMSKKSPDALLASDAEQAAPAPIPTELDLKEIESKMPGIDEPAAANAQPPKVKHIAVKPAGPVVEKIGFSASVQQFDPGAKFAEIHVLRSAVRGEKTSFVWWTEAGSAAPDADFQPQGHTTAYFPARNSMTTLFVKLVPNAKRKKPQVFYLNIADAGGGAVIGATSRTAITLLPRGA
jgi:serine/threonine protein kinase